MTTSSAPTPEYGAPALPVTGALPPRRDLSDADRIAALRAALQLVVPVLAYCAGREAADDPKQAAVVLAAADEAAQALARTA
ncbi:hypothetical protein [Streptomyces sp. MMS24-I29]|uniref:hypothetical protein n=1 Tax=Streptomyces sp. MMS24-I29 TaxID=3351480 RepID=UPI003C7D0718